MSKYLIIDGSSILFRAFYALPPMNTKNGEQTNAVLGFMNIILKAIEMVDPTNIAVCFDLKGKTFRTEIYEDYKGNRTAAPEELLEQFIYIKEVLNAFNINYFELQGFEADDLAGTLSKEASQKGSRVYLLSGDKDYLQLIDENTSLLYTKTGVSELKEYTEKVLKEELDLRPDQIVELKALMGDKSDNIPGIDGVGEKTALKLLKEFENIDNLYASKDSLKKNKTNQKIIDGEEIARLSKDLATIDRDVPIDLENINTQIIKYDEDKLTKVLNKYELNSLIKRLNLNQEEDLRLKKKEIDVIKTGDFSDVKKDIEKSKEFAFKILSTDKAYKNGDLFKIGIKVDENYYLIDINNNLKELKEEFESPSIIKHGYDIKEDIISLINSNIDLKNYKTDITIGEYLLNPTNNDYSIEKLSTVYGVDLYESMPDKKLLTKSPKTWSEEEINSYLINVINIIDLVRDRQEESLTEKNMINLYRNIELPLTKVLADMEYTGVYVDKNALLEIGKDLDSELEILINNIYSLAGEEFNINSPKQLSEILFDKLKLPTIKKTKTGYSTNIDVLERLEDKHEIISHIIRYRTISKLKNTYVDGLVDYINQDNGRIHSNFQQTIAATGRLSSTDPNLQNIPVKTEEGRQLRKIFKAKSSNFKLVDADYSQIELRLLADISKDENMIQSFKDKIDIHTTTASKVFKVDHNDVTPLMRSNAKAVNFGIVYGVSDYGLSQNLKISRKEAKEYIDNYLEEFNGVNSYMTNIVITAREMGYVETKFGRRRYLPELESKNRNIQGAGERIALNMPIQGTAADIIKIAMVNVYNSLKEKKLDTKLILQIHDELILEAPIEELEEVKGILKDEMERAVDLSVPLTVDLETGDSWYDTK